MDMSTYQEIQSQLKQQPNSSAVDICTRLNIPVKNFYAMRQRIKSGKKPRTFKQRKPAVAFSVPMASSAVAPRARVFVVACWADELDSVIRGLQ